MADCYVFTTVLCLVLGLGFSILALSTNHWYKYEIDIENNLAINYFGLWKACVKVDVEIPVSLSENLCLSYIGDKDDFVEKAIHFVNRETGLHVDTDDLSETEKDELYKKFYPDYLKAIQGMELIAAGSGLTAIVVWLLQFCIQPGKSSIKGIKVGTVCFIILTGVMHSISIITWIIHKEKDRIDLIGDGPNPGYTFSYGYSMYAAVLSGIVSKIAIIFVVLSRRDKLNDGMTVSLYRA